MTATANFYRPDNRASSSFGGFSSDINPAGVHERSIEEGSRDSRVNPLRTNTGFMAPSEQPKGHYYNPVAQWGGAPREGSPSIESEEDESEYEGEESEFEEGESGPMNSGSNSSLSQYEMSAEMKGFYQHENLNPHRSSMGSNSMITSMTSGVGVNRPP